MIGDPLRRRYRLLLDRLVMATPLRVLRETKGLSQDDLARASGVSKSAIVDLELGRRKPRPSTRRRLAQALEIKPEELSFESSPRTS
jgi:transcriptional regulator with XRE-family HTH domain